MQKRLEDLFYEGWTEDASALLARAEAHYSLDKTYSGYYCFLPKTEDIFLTCSPSRTFLRFNYQDRWRMHGLDIDNRVHKETYLSYELARLWLIQNGVWFNDHESMLESWVSEYELGYPQIGSVLGLSESGVVRHHENALLDFSKIKSSDFPQDRTSLGLVIVDIHQGKSSLLKQYFSGVEKGMARLRDTAAFFAYNGMEVYAVVMKGKRLPDWLLPYVSEANVFEKNDSFSAFSSRYFSRAVQSSGVSSLVVAGFNRDACVFQTAMDASRHYRVISPESLMFYRKDISWLRQTTTRGYIQRTQYLPFYFQLKHLLHQVVNDSI